MVVMCGDVLVILVGTAGDPVVAVSPQLWQSYDCTCLSPSDRSKVTDKPISWTTLAVYLHVLWIIKT